MEMNLGKQLISKFKEKIYSKSFQRMYRIGENSFIRNRKLPFPTVFSMILKLVKKSLGIECELMEPLELKIPPSKQAFSKARYKIHHAGFQELLECSVEIALQNPAYGTWRGYRHSEEIGSEFGRFKPNGTSGKMPPLARVSLFVDLCTSMICSARLAAWNVGEQTLAEQQLPEVVMKMRGLAQKNLLFIYDRGYPSLKFIKEKSFFKCYLEIVLPKVFKNSLIEPLIEQK